MGAKSAFCIWYYFQFYKLFQAFKRLFLHRIGPLRGIVKWLWKRVTSIIRPYLKFWSVLYSRSLLNISPGWRSWDGLKRPWRAVQYMPHTCAAHCSSNLSRSPPGVTSGRRVLPPAWAEGKFVNQVLPRAKSVHSRVRWYFIAPR